MDQNLLTKGLGATALCLCVPICVSLSRPSDVSVFGSRLGVPASHRSREKAQFRDPFLKKKKKTLHDVGENRA